LRKKAKIDHQNSEGNTALHLAAKNAAPDVVVTLLSAGADFKITNKEHKTALQVSAEFKCSEALLKKTAQSPESERKAFLDTEDVGQVRAFLKKYPNDVEIFTDVGDTKLILAARANLPVIVKCLVDEFGASVNNPNMAHSSPLMASSMRGYDEIVTYLISKGANINQRTTNLDSCLSLAVWKNMTSTAKLLIGAGANVTGIDRFGDSMLHDAAKNGNTGLTEFFLTKTIDINHQNKEGLSPLHRASEFGHADVIKILLTHKANPKLKNVKGELAEQIAKDDECRSLLHNAK